MRRKILILLVFLGGCGGQRGLPYYRTADLTPEWLGASQARDIHRIGDFRLLDQRGDTLTADGVAGRITVVNFFLADCGTVCPTMMRALARVQDSFATDDRVLMLSHSAAPRHDSVAVLARYATMHGIRAERWRLLTGEASQISRLAREGYFVRRDVTEDPAAPGVVHTEMVSLVDGQGRIRGVYDGSLAFDISHLIADIRVLEREPQNP